MSRNRRVALTAKSLATRTNVARLLRCVSGAEMISMKVSLRDPSFALIAVVPMPHRLEIALFGRRKRESSASALKNAPPFRETTVGRSQCRLWSLAESPSLLLFPSVKKSDLWSVKLL